MLLLTSVLALNLAQGSQSSICQFFIECEIWSVSSSSAVRFGDKEIASCTSDGTIKEIGRDRQVAQLKKDLSQDRLAQKIMSPKMRTIENEPATVGVEGDSTFGSFSISPSQSSHGGARCVLGWNPNGKLTARNGGKLIAFDASSGHEVALTTRSAQGNLVVFLKVSKMVDNP